MAAKPIFVQAVDTNGTPYSGAKLNVYDAGTTTPRAIYTESGLGTASANPAIADANGVVVVWVNDAGGDIKVTLTNSAETVTPHNEDNVPIASLTCYPVITFQGDQSLLTTSSPTFAGLTLGNVSFAGVVTDPNADRLVFWDDSAGQVNFMTLGTGLAFNGTALELDGDLQDISGLTPTDGGVIIGDGTDFVIESGSTLRTSIGVTIGSDVQAWDADLDVYAANPLTAAELGELQNIGSTAISATQWGYVGGLDQALATTDSPTFATVTSTSSVIGGVTVSPSGATLGQALGFPNNTSTLEPYTPAGGGDTLAAANETISGNWNYTGAPTLSGSPIVSRAATETLTNKTLTSPVLDGTLSGTAFLDEDDMASDSATKVASQQSVKAYVDSRSVAQTVDDLTALKALTTSEVSAGDTVQMRYRDSVGDHGWGLFEVFSGAASANEWLEGKATAGTSTGTAMVSDDGIVVQNTAGNLTFVRVFESEVNTAWYGTSPSKSAADNTTAFNAAFNFLRSRIYGTNSNENSVPTVMTPPGVYEVNSINATQIRAAGWSWIGSGATIKGVGAGKAVVDLLHSRQFTLNGITVEGDTTNKPRLGFQTGYMAGQTSSGSYHFIGVFTKGQFSLAAYLNGGGEEISHVGCQFENEDSASTSYSVIEDGWNFWGKRSDYISRSATNDHLADSVEGVTQANPAVVTITGHSFSNGDVVMFRDVGGMTELNGNYYTVANAAANTFELSGVNSTGFTAYTSGGFVHELKPESFVQSQFNNCAAFKSVGGPAVWQSGNVDRHAWVSSYILSKDSHGVVQKIDPTIQSKYPQHTHLDVGFEGTSLQHALYFDRTGTSNLTFNMSGLYIKDHGPQTDTALIGTNDASASSIYSFIGGHIELANFAGASVKVVDTQAKFRFTGDFISRNTAAITDFPEPFFGRMMIPDANTSALPEGAYDIVTPVNNGSESEYSIRKGVHRFYGDDAAIASGSLSSGDYVELAGEYVKLPNLTSNPTLTEGTFFYRNDLLKIYDGAYNQSIAMGPAVGSMATDTAVSIDIPGPGNVSAMAVISCDGSAGPHALVWVRGTSAACSLFSTAQANVTVTTGVLTGTTGTSGDFTISAHSDGKMYLENRQATTLVVNVTWMSVTQ